MFIVFFAVLLIVWFVASWWARLLVYRDANKGEYIGDTRYALVVEDKYLVNPLGEGRPQFIDAQELDRFSPELNEITFFPRQEQVIYAVGQVVGWEDIPMSKDKYLMLKHGKGTDQEEEARYRVSFEESDLYGAETSKVYVEKISLGGGANSIQPYGDGSLVGIGYFKARLLMIPAGSDLASA